MSVVCLIANPQNEFEQSFCFPIATENTYTNYWQKFAQANQLYWLEFMQYGIDIEHDKLDEIIAEIQQFYDFILTTDDIFYTENGHLAYFKERIPFILKKLEEVKAMRNDIVISIG